MSGTTRVSPLCSETIFTGSILKARNQYLFLVSERCWYVREGLRAVLREHGHHHLIHNFQFRLVKRSDFHEDILGVECDL